jgi:hypothetical protein
MRIECQHFEKDVYEFLCLYSGITDVPQDTSAEVIDWCSEIDFVLLCVVVIVYSEFR